MSVPTWVIQSNLLANKQQTPWVDACIELGIPWTDVAVIPFSEEPLDIKVPGNMLIPYGSTRLIKYALKEDWKGLFFNEENFKTSTWMANRGDMLNSIALIVKLSGIKNYLELYQSLYDNEPLFFRPNNDLKSFPGFKCRPSDFNIFLDNATHGGCGLEEMQEIVIAKIQDIQAEWRYFVVDHKVIDGSMYRCRGQMYTEHEEDSKVLAEAQKLAEDWLPDDVVCMDVALTDIGLKVVEFNCFNCSGIYRHNTTKVVRTVTDYVNRVA